MIFLPHTNTVILLEPYCGTITEPGLPVVIIMDVNASVGKKWGIKGKDNKGQQKR